MASQTIVPPIPMATPNKSNSVIGTASAGLMRSIYARRSLTQWKFCETSFLSILLVLRPRKNQSEIEEERRRAVQMKASSTFVMGNCHSGMPGFFGLNAENAEVHAEGAKENQLKGAWRRGSLCVPLR